MKKLNYIKYIGTGSVLIISMFLISITMFNKYCCDEIAYRLKKNTDLNVLAVVLRRNCGAIGPNAYSVILVRHDDSNFKSGKEVFSGSHGDINIEWVGNTLLIKYDDTIISKFENKYYLYGLDQDPKSFRVVNIILLDESALKIYHDQETADRHEWH